ncbi:Phospholipase B-like protein B, partial [Durusdinium trenchii]
EGRQGEAEEEMGGVWSKLMEVLYAKKLEVVLVGLENAGKTSLLNVLSNGQPVETCPTIGLNVKIVNNGGVALKCWDIGGQAQYREEWSRYSRGCDVIIFVVDAADPARVEEAKIELHRLLEDRELATTPILVASNKIDVEPHMLETEIIRNLNLDYVVDNPWVVVPVSALRNLNVDRILQWLIGTLTRHAGASRALCGAEVVHGREAVVVETSDGSLKLGSAPGAGETVIAAGCFDDSQTERGFGRLVVETFRGEADLLLEGRAAGMLEGFLTAVRICQSFKNIMSLRNPALNEERRAFMAAQIASVRRKIASATDQDHEYYANVAMILAQLEGLREGLMLRRKMDPSIKALSFLDLWDLNSDGDVMDIEPSLALQKRATKAGGASGDDLLLLQSISSARERRSQLETRDAQEREESETWMKSTEDFSREQFSSIMSKGHCTGIVRLTPNNGDLLVGHNAWASFALLLRIVKRVDIAGHVMASSSYPGLISSSDDFYVLSSGLVVFETTILTLNQTALATISPTNGLPSWVRSLVSNRLATDGPSWVAWYRRENSGTYNCQWVVVDVARFTPHARSLRPHTLTVVETMPELIVHRDLSDELQSKRTFASTNLPRFTETRVAAGYNRTCSAKQKNECMCLSSADESPRACAVMRHARHVADLKTFRALLRRNKYRQDNGRPDWAIAGRCDLLRKAPVMYGAVDAKATSMTMLTGSSRNLQFWFISGVSTDDGALPAPDPNLWKPGVSHEGVDFTPHSWFLVT